MNEYLILGITVVGSIALPAWAAIFAITRASKEAKWQDALWQEHQLKDASTPPKPIYDEKMRAQLRTEMRDLGGISAVTALVALRGGVLTFLVLLEVALLWHLTHHEPISTNTFWVLTAVIAFVLGLIGVLTARSAQER